MPSKIWDEITHPFLNFNGWTVEVWKWISDFISYFIMDVITYPCCDWIYSLLVKGCHRCEQSSSPMVTWWRHQMETFSASLALCAGNSPVPGEFPAQRPVTRSFDIFFDLRLNKRLNKQPWGWWFETSPCSLWRHYNELSRPDWCVQRVWTVRLCQSVSDGWVMTEWLARWTQLWVMNRFLWDSGAPGLRLVSELWSNSLLVGIYHAASAQGYVFMSLHIN